MDAEMLRNVLTMLGTVLGAILVLMLVAKITSMVHVEADDVREPIDSMEASVVGKRTLVTQEDGAPKTIYYMTFQKVNGMRMELEVPGEDYGLAAEGDQGVLVARGEEFIVFKRMICNDWSFPNKWRRRRGGGGERKAPSSRPQTRNPLQ